MILLQCYRLQKQACSISINYLLKYPESPNGCFHRIKADEIRDSFQGSPLIPYVLNEATLSHNEYMLYKISQVVPNARSQINISSSK
jgi:predicted cupin superfamily sugar epimerase